MKTLSSRPVNKYIILFIVLLAFGFRTALSQPSCTEPASMAWITEHERCYYSQTFGFDVPEKWNKILYDSIENWLGTPYRYAGNNHDGVDCSGLVRSLCSGVYNSVLSARNSADIYKSIKHVKKQDLREGDLVFFRIRTRSISHVGIFIGNNKFVHASSGSGVIISDLGEPYYRKYFAGGGRINLLASGGASPE
jgi:murein DD-endopeptidase / murein LD-carboxypeptidase